MKRKFIFLLETGATRKELGLPALWIMVWSWLVAAALEKPYEIEEKAPKPSKFPNIPILSDYCINPDLFFWRHFPSKSLPTGVTTPIRINRLKNLIRRNGKNWNQQQRWVAKRALENIERGAITHTKYDLPPIRCKNADSATIHGSAVTETIAD